jgi:hypothetical protein
MANPTSNFNWQMPTASDLVTDLPADFEVFGQAVDTSLADLKGGTTGQVLSKTSGTDMDFTWVDTDDTNAIQNAIVDAKGDLIAASAADTPARLAVGNNGETLVADSSTSTGLRYQGSMAAGKNNVINGAMDNWQRGTSLALTTSFAYLADRWYGLVSASTTMTTSRSTDAPTGFQYSMKTQRTAGVTSLGYPIIYTAIETSNSIPYAGQTVTMSVWVKKGANYSGGSFRAILWSGTGTNQGGYASTWTGAAGQTLSITPTTTWTRYSTTYAVPSGTTQLGIQTDWEPTGTAGADDSLSFTGVQIEIGSVATQFTRAGGTIQGELSACQRYYYILDLNNSGIVGTGYARSTTRADLMIQHPVQMRANPTFTATGNLTIEFGTSGSSTTSTVTGSTLKQRTAQIYTANTGLTAASGVIAYLASGAKLEYSAEI